MQAQHNQLKRGVDIVAGTPGRIKEAHDVFKLMQEKNVYSGSMLNGFAMHGSARSAIELLEKMVKANVKPNPVTFLGVLTACCHGGLLDEGRRGDSEDTLHLVITMFMEPNAGVWGALHVACRLHANPTGAEVAAKRFFKLEPTNVGNYILLCDAYAKARKSEAALWLQLNFPHLHLEEKVIPMEVES